MKINKVYLKLFTAILTIALIATAVPLSVSGEQSKKATTENDTTLPVISCVTLSLQKENTFLLTPKSETVSSILAESYGYKDNVSGSVSALDVLLREHELIYGEDFTAENCRDYLEVDDGGSVSKVMGEDTYSFSFAIDNKYPYDENSEYGTYGYTGYTVNQASVKAGSSVDFFFYQDSYYMDKYTWFEQNGEYKNSITVRQNENIDLMLLGFTYMFGSYTKDDLIKMDQYGAIEDARIALTDKESGCLTDITDKISDEDGKVTLNFDVPGTYYVSAYSEYDDTYEYIISPWLKIVVQDTTVPIQSLTVRTSSSTADLSNAILTDENDCNIAVFNNKTYNYELGDILYDTNIQLRFWYTLTEYNTEVKLTWGENGTRVLSTGSDSSKNTEIKNKWANCISVGKNTLKLTVTPPDGSLSGITTYILTFNCLPTITDLSAKSGTLPLYLDNDFKYSVNSYNLSVPSDARTVTIDSAKKSDEYNISYNGNESNIVDISKSDIIKIIVSCGNGNDSVNNVYTLKLERKGIYTYNINTNPLDAVIRVFDKTGQVLSPETDGSYKGMFSDFCYTYVITKYGYITQKGVVPSVGGNLQIALEKAPESGIQDVGAFWPNFRSDNSNMAITTTRLPFDASNTSLKWSAKLGTGWTDSPSVQIIADDALIVMSGKKIYKLNLETGKILKTADMVDSPSFGYTPPTYAKGMIFCPLSNGTVEAFDAKTLEPLWVYKDKLGGQSLSPITYSEGYIYTGFWNGETKKANFVAISITDEDPKSDSEQKVATWDHTITGGFYWAGAAVIGNAVVVGTDDGTNGSTGTSRIYSFNKFNGTIISSYELVGDQRSSIAYDSLRHKIFFTTKAGYLYSAKIDSSNGTISGIKGVNYNAQTTSTPLVYKNRVYFGTGSGISTSGSSGNIVVADADSLEMLYSIGLKGYPQCSLLMSTAYEESTGYIYLYSTYNMNPGGISMIKVKPEAVTAENAQLIELYDAAEFSQYCISSVICGSNGTLYYKNDSGNVLAVSVKKANGDLDGNGIINSSDIVVMRKGLINKGNAELDLFDLDNDKKVTVKDLVRLKKYVLNIK